MGEERSDERNAAPGSPQNPDFVGETVHWTVSGQSQRLLAGEAQGQGSENPAIDLVDSDSGAEMTESGDVDSSDDPAATDPSGQDLASSETPAATDDSALSPLGVMPMASVATLNLADTTTLNLNNADSSLGFSYSGTTVTFNANSAGQEYTIQGNGGSIVRSIQFLAGATGVTVNLSGVTVAAGTPALGLASGASVTLNLVSGTTNSFTSANNYAGVSVPAGATLTVVGTGMLTAQGGANGAGIGGSNAAAGTINITDGTVNATGGSAGAGIGGANAQSCGAIHISGGTVTATGADAGAGIGGGSGSTTGSVRISGGTVTATGSNGDNFQGSAGIGAGIGAADLSPLNSNQITIVIDNGNVTAYGLDRNAGIGGTRGSTYDITINGGTIKAYGGNYGAGIGGGIGSAAGNIVINGGDVYAVAGIWNNNANTQDGAGIGPGGGGTPANLSLDAAATVVAVSMGGSNVAINCTGNTGTGYYINGILATSVVTASPFYLDMFHSDNDGAVVGSTTLPGNYRSIGFSTGSATQNTYRIYKMSAPGGVRQSILTRVGYPGLATLTSQKGTASNVVALTFGNLPPETTINFTDESITGFSAAENATAMTWFRAANEAGPWTNMTTGVVSGTIALSALGVLPDSAGGSDKKSYIAFSTNTGANVPTSVSQELTIVPRPATPTLPAGGTMEITGLATDGSMEYRKAGETTWTSAGSAGTVAVSSGGTYYVRVAAVESSPTPAYNNGSFHSDSKTVTVLDATPLGAIDYINEAITGMSATNSPAAQTWLYSTDYNAGTGAGSWTAFTPTSNTATLASLGGSTPNAYGGATKNLYIAYSALPSATAPSSAVQTLTIKARPQTPTGITGGIDKITGVVANGTQEYRRDDDSTWTEVIAAPQTTSSTGTFYVRIKAVPNTASPSDNGSFASDYVSATVLSDALLAINGGGDMSLTYPSDLETEVKAKTVTPSSGTVSWYYATNQAGPYTQGFPDKPDTYYIYATVTASGIYAAAQSVTIKVTWNKKLLDISPDASFTKVYDGTVAVVSLPGLPGAFPALTDGAVGESGDVEPGDTVSVSGPALNAYSFAHATTAANNSVTALATGFTLSGSAAGGTNNADDYYTLGTSTLTWAAAITAAPVTVSFTGMTFTKTYDGNSDAAGSGSAPSLSGIVSPDSVSLNSDAVTYFYGTDASTPTADASIGLEVYLNAASYNSFYLEGADATNYSLTQPTQATSVSTTGIITPKVIDANPANYDSTYGIDWYFDSSTSPETVSSTNPTPSVLYTLAGHSITAKVKPAALASQWDSVTITLTGTTSATAPGTYTATTATTTLGGPQGSNYVLSQAISQPWQIAGRPPSSPYDLTADSSGAPSVLLSWAAPTFNGGSPIANYQVQYMEMTGGKSSADIPSLQESDWTSGSPITITPSPASVATSMTVTALTPSTNYAWRVRATNSSSPGPDDWGPWSTPGSVAPDTIDPTLVIKTPLTCTYGETLADILSAATTTPGSVLSATSTTSYGGYTAGTEMDGTWSWRDVNGASVDGIIPSNNAPGTTDTYTLVFTPNSSLADYYGANTTEATITVTPKELTILYSGLLFEKAYNGRVGATNQGSIPQVDTTAIIDGNGDGSFDDVNIGVTGVSYVYDNANAATAKSVYLSSSGSNYTLTGTDAANYSIGNLPALRTGATGGDAISTTGVITPRPLTFAWTLGFTTITNPAAGTNSVVFDSNPHTVSATPSGMVAGEVITTGYGSSVRQATNADSYQAVAASISVTNSGGPNTNTVAGNYDIAVASATQDWQITKRPVSVHWTDLSFEYDTAAHLPTATYTAVAADSTASALSITVTGGPVNASGGAIDAGTYTALASMPTTSNYSLTGTTTQSFNITQKVLKLDFTKILAKLTSLPYSGETTIDITDDTMPTLDEGSGAGEVYSADKLGTDVVLSVGNAKWHLSGSDVAGGPYDLNIDGNFALTGSRAANYALVPGQSWAMMSGVANIAPRPLDFIWELDGNPISGTSVDVSHDGLPHTVTAIVTNPVTGQALTVASYTTPSTLSATDDGSYTATVASVASDNGSATDPANYTLTGATGATLTWNIVKAVDKSALIALNNKVLSEDLHEENYTAAAWSALQSALADANTVINDAGATQTQVNDALATLQTAYNNMKHDHPVLKHSHDVNYGGVNHLTRFGDTVIIEFKGDIRDVTGFALNGAGYPLTSSGVNIYNITEGGTVIGTITDGSAIVTLPATFADRLANGTHTVEVIFTDATGTGIGTAELVVDRSSGGGNGGGNDGGGNGNGPDKEPAILPQTGDAVSPALILVATFSLCGLLLVLFVLRRKHKQKKRGKHAA